MERGRRGWRRGCFRITRRQKADGRGVGNGGQRYHRRSILTGLRRSTVSLFHFLLGSSWSGFLALRPLTLIFHVLEYSHPQFWALSICSVAFPAYGFFTASFRDLVSTGPLLMFSADYRTNSKFSYRQRPAETFAAGVHFDFSTSLLASGSRYSSRPEANTPYDT
jgi:hypothetical protein